MCLRDAHALEASRRSEVGDGFAGHPALHVPWGCGGAAHDESGDYVLATGKPWTIREALDLAFVATDSEDWTRCVTTDPRFVRPAELDPLGGDSSRPREALGWEPKIEFPDLLHEMVTCDVECRAGADEGGTAVKAQRSR